MKKQTLAIVAVLLANTAQAETIYYCTKNGKKIVTDQPCQDLGASEKKRIDGSEMKPLSTMQAPTQSQINQARQIDYRNQQQARIDEQQKQARQQAQQNAKAQNKDVCAKLEQEKQNYTSAQRMPNSMQRQDWYREQLRYVNDEIYRLQCETL